MAAFDPVNLYTSERTALVQQLRSLTAEQAKTVVPACPAWTVKDVAAHLSGLVAETLADVPPPRGSDEATSRQVSDRADQSLAEICDEWEANGPAFTKYGSADPNFTTLLVADLTVHLHDMFQALAIPVDETSDATVVSAERYLERLQQRAADQLGIALSVELEGVGLHAASAGSAPLALTATPFDFLRSVTGRRTPAEVAALDWTGDPSELIAGAFYQYQPSP